MYSEEYDIALQEQGIHNTHNALEKFCGNEPLGSLLVLDRGAVALWVLDGCRNTSSRWNVGSVLVVLGLWVKRLCVLTLFWMESGAPGLGGAGVGLSYTRVMV